MVNKESETQKNWNDFFQNDKPVERAKLNPLIIAAIFICVISAAIYFTGRKELDEIPLTNIPSNAAYKQPNKNGQIMSESIDTISYIFVEQITGSSEEELLSYIETIENTDLSIEYTGFKSKMIEKINYYIEYTRNPSQASMDKYNNINFDTELMKAFDAADVKYTFLEDGQLKYWYLE